jgi:hypothetical protein
MLDLGPYLLGVLKVALVAGSLAFAAYRLRQRYLAEWEGPPARLVEVVVAVALLTWIAQLLGSLSIFHAWGLLAVSILVAVLSLPQTSRTPATTASAQGVPAAGGLGGDAEDGATPRPQASPPRTGPAARSAMSLAALTVVGLVVFDWAITTHHALDRGMFNFDTLWYHQPFAVEMVQNHSLTGMWHTETVFTNWFYPQGSELLHAVGIALTERDTLSLFLNFGWLAVAFLAAWCIGRPYGRGQLSLVAVAILLGCHTLVVRQPGAAKNDLMAAALLLAAIAILVEAWNRTRPSPGAAEVSDGTRPKGLPRIEAGWALAAAGLAVGLAAGTKVTVLAMAAALSVAVLVLAPRGRRWAAAGWWFVPALLGGGFWYLRNLVVAGNPLPAVESLGPISLPHPERLQIGRPDFNIAHYATDTGVWSEYFGPGLQDAFGALWFLVLGGAVVAAVWALFAGRDRIVRAAGAVALFGMLAYLFTPLSAAGAEGEPVGFAINVRFVVPALLLALALLPLPRALDPPRRQWGLLAALVLIFLVTDRPDEALRDPSRPFALLLAVLLVALPAAILLARQRGASRGLLLGALAALAIAVVAIGYPVQRHYLDSRFANDGAKDKQIPGMDLDSAYRWASGVEDARIGLAGTTAGFAGYGFYGTDLSNQVIYLGVRGPHGAFNAIPTCAGFRAAVNGADLDYLVTSPFLNFLHPSEPVASPEARWLRGSDAVRPVLRSGPVTVWEVTGRLDPAGCDGANAPLFEIPDTPPS